MTVEWLEVQDGVGASATCIDYVPANAANHAVIRNNLIRNCGSQSIRLSGPSTVFVADINNNVIYRGVREAVRVDSPLGTGTGSQVRVFNNTFLRNSGAAAPSEHRDQHRRDAEPLRRPAQQHPGGRRAGARRHLAMGRRFARAPPTATGGTRPAGTTSWATPRRGARPPTGRPTSARTHGGGGVASATEASLNFVNTTATSENLHIQSGSSAWNSGFEPDRLRVRRHRRRGPHRALGRRRRRAPAGRRAAADRLQRRRGIGAPRPALLDPPGSGLDRAGLTAVPGPFSTGAPLFSKVARTHPNGTRRAAVASENDGAAGGAKLQVSLFDGTNWDNGLGAPFSDAQQFTSTLSTPMTMRHFDAAYEQLSGELLLVSGANTDDTVFIWTYNGTAWSANLYFTPLGNGQHGTNSEDLSNTFRWIRLKPGPARTRSPSSAPRPTAPPATARSSPPPSGTGPRTPSGRRTP